MFFFVEVLVLIIPLCIIFWNLFKWNYQFVSWNIKLNEEMKLYATHTLWSILQRYLPDYRFGYFFNENLFNTNEITLTNNLSCLLMFIRIFSFFFNWIAGKIVKKKSIPLWVLDREMIKKRTAFPLRHSVKRYWNHFDTMETLHTHFLIFFILVQGFCCCC